MKDVITTLLLGLIPVAIGTAIIGLIILYPHIVVIFFSGIFLYVAGLFVRHLIDVQRENSR